MFYVAIKCKLLKTSVLRQQGKNVNIFPIQKVKMAIGSFSFDLAEYTQLDGTTL